MSFLNKALLLPVANLVLLPRSMKPLKRAWYYVKLEGGARRSLPPWALLDRSAMSMTPTVIALRTFAWCAVWAGTPSHKCELHVPRRY